MGQAIKWKGWRVGRQPSTLLELMKIGSSISDFINIGITDREIQAGVINTQELTLSRKTFSSALGMRGIGGKT